MFEVLLHRFCEDGDDQEVRRLLEAAWDAPPNEHMYSRVRRGAGEAELYGEPPGSPIRSLTFTRPKGGHEIFDLLVDIARAGRMVIIPLDCIPCVAAQADVQTFPERMAEDYGAPVVVANGRQLLDIIEAT